MGRRRYSLRAWMYLAPWLCCGIAVAQDLEPRRWTPLPVGTNFVGVGYAFSTGDLSFDPVLRIDDATVELHTVLISYVHSFPLFDKTARVDVRLPIQSGRWKGVVDGVPTEVHRDGLADPVVRLSIDFVGAPALREQEYQQYHREHATSTVVGAAVGLGLTAGRVHG